LKQTDCLHEKAIITRVYTCVSVCVGDFFDNRSVKHNFFQINITSSTMCQLFFVWHE